MYDRFWRTEGKKKIVWQSDSKYTTKSELACELKTEKTTKEQEVKE